MLLHRPIAISARLLPAVEIGGAWISIEPTTTTDNAGRLVWQWYIDLPDGAEHTAADLATHPQGNEEDSVRAALASLLSFLSACGEAISYQRSTGRESENADLFPPQVAEWADQSSDEIGMVAWELEEEDYS